MIYLLMLTRNTRVELMKRAVASVLAQVGADFKLIVGENGVTITDPELVALLVDPRVMCVALGTEFSIPAARNILAENAGPGDNLMLIDDDDYLLPGCLQQLLEHLPAHGLVYGNCLEERSDGKLWQHKSCSAEYSKENMLLTSCIFHPALFTHTLFLEAGGFDENHPKLSVYDFFVRVSEVPNVKVYHLRTPLYVYHCLDGHESTRSDPARAAAIADVRARAVARREANEPIVVTDH